MAVPSTSTWTLDADQVITAALERLPGPLDQAYDLDKARRALQLTFNRLTARQIMNFKTSVGTLTLIAGQISYVLPSDEHDVLEMMIRDPASLINPTEVPVGRIARDAYHMLPDKQTLGRPVNFWVQRGRDARSLYFWPKPDRAYIVSYQRVVLFRDVGTMVDHLDVPQTWLSVLIAGCAYFLGISTPQADTATRQELERLFELEISLIETEDRDRGTLSIIPDLSAYSR